MSTLCVGSPACLRARHPPCRFKHLPTRTCSARVVFCLPWTDGASNSGRAASRSISLAAGASAARDDSSSAGNTGDESSNWIARAVARWRACVGARGGCRLLLKLAIWCALGGAVLAMGWAAVAVAAPHSTAVSKTIDMTASLTVGAPEQQWWRWVSYKVQKVGYQPVY